MDGGGRVVSGTTTEIERRTTPGMGEVELRLDAYTDVCGRTAPGASSRAAIEEAKAECTGST